MYKIRNVRSRLWLKEYPLNHNLHKLKFAWTLSWSAADSFSSEYAAREKACSLGLTEGEYRLDAIKKTLEERVSNGL